MTDNCGEAPPLSADAERLLGSARGQIAMLARAFARSAQDAEALEREMALAIARDFDDFCDKKDASAWAARVALEVCQVHARRRRLERAAGEALKKHGLPVGDEQLGADAGKATVKLERALAQLEPHQAEAIRMRSLAIMPYAQIAETLELPPGEVQATVLHAREQLAELLEPDREELAAMRVTEDLLSAERQRRAPWGWQSRLPLRILRRARAVIAAGFRSFRKRSSKSSS
jgi:RNA polymerase sigma factor (sigma-70 family)